MDVLWMIFALVAPYLTQSADPAGWTEQHLVAHGMGGIDGNRVTNSREAFVENYGKGFRVFEVDLLLTSDGHLAARHDWDPYLYGMLEQDKPEVADKEPLSLAEFKSMPIHRKYRPLDFADIVGLLKEYPDAYIVTDTKERSGKGVKKQFGEIVDTARSMRPEVLKRIVPQLYNQKMYDRLEAIYPFHSYIYTLYESTDSDKEVLAFVEKHPKIRAVTMSETRVSQALVAALKERGVKTYVHTVNGYFAYQMYRSMGVDGIYTDFLNSGEIARNIRQTREAGAVLVSTVPASAPQ